jgi:hypothetical protein
MIHNEQQLAIVRRQLALIDEALESLRREVLPKKQEELRGPVRRLRRSDYGAAAGN